MRYKGYNFTETFKSKTRARKWGERKEREIDEGEAPTAESTKRTIDDVIVTYVDDKLDESLDGNQKLKNQLKIWGEIIGDKKLCDVTPATISKARRQIQNVKTTRGDRRSNATVNRFVFLDVENNNRPGIDIIPGLSLTQEYIWLQSLQEKPEKAPLTSYASGVKIHRH